MSPPVSPNGNGKGFDTGTDDPYFNEDVDLAKEVLAEWLGSSDAEDAAADVVRTLARAKHSRSTT